MANVSMLIFGAAIAVASVSTPVLAAHKTSNSAHRNGYVTRSSQGRGVYNFAPVPGSFDDSAGSYGTTPFSAGEY
jgi:hypothetical protein